MLWRHLTPRTPHWLPVGASPLLRPEGVFSRVLGESGTSGDPGLWLCWMVFPE